MINKDKLPFKIGDLVTTSKKIILPDSMLRKTLIWQVINVHLRDHLAEDIPYLHEDDVVYKIKTINNTHEAYIDDLHADDLLPYKNALQRIKEKVAK